MALFLNTVFYGFDKAMFLFVNRLTNVAGSFLTPFFEFITFFGDKGWFFIALGVILLLFLKHRKAGVCILLAIVLGGLFTNIILKKAVQRPRPYTVEEFKILWQAVGASKESEFSFPSGHTTSAFACAMAFFLSKNKKYSWTLFIFALLVAFSRIYLVVHYTTDVIGGIISGSLAGVIAYFITNLIYKVIEKNSQNIICSFINSFDIIDCFKKKK